MLHKYSFTNFQSFHERTEIDFSISRKISPTDWMVEAQTGELVSKLMAVIGPNGSGKTALLKPLAFLAWFVGHSFQNAPDANIPVTPHFAYIDEPTEFVSIVDFNGSLWRYELICTPERVLHEALYKKVERFSYVFVREWNESTKSYKVKQQDFGLKPAEAVKVRQNVSLISWAAQYNVPLAQRMAAAYVITNVNVQGRLPMGDQALLSAAQHFSSKKDQFQRTGELLSSWDLGLNGVDLMELPVGDPQAPEQKIWIPMGKHVSHSKEFSLPFAFESTGTQGAFVLLSRLLETLEIGGLAVIDEFESDLHPHMLEPILDLFANPKFNPHNAQLIFTCHAIEVLNLLNKSQVMLVQKDSECESAACRLDDVEGIRHDDNFYAKYMAGAYGAVPEL